MNLSKPRAWAREIKLHGTAVRERFCVRGGRRVLFFPFSGGHIGSVKLRCEAAAEALAKHGWLALVVPPHLSLGARRRLLRSFGPDVVVLQKSQHPLNRPGLYPGRACVLDIDDADYVLDEHREGVDACLRGCRAVIAGSRVVAEHCAKLNEDVTVIWTGSPSAPLNGEAEDESGSKDDEQDAGLPIVTWASSSLDGFWRERAIVQAALLETVRRHGVTFRYRQYGVRDPETAAAFRRPLEDAGLDVAMVPPMPYENFLASVAQCDVGLHVLSPDDDFNLGKSFGKVLAYLIGGVPVAASDAAEHPAFFEHQRNGLLVGPTPEQWADAIGWLLADRERRARIGRAGHASYAERLSIDAFTARMAAVFDRACSGSESR